MNDSILILDIIQRFIFAMELKQSFMVPFFSNNSVLHNDDPVGIFDGGQAVGNDQGGSVFH